jgi:uncharacterized protein with PIN domain
MAWQHNSIGQKAAAPLAASDPACFAWGKDRTQHIVYHGTDDQVHELWYRHGTDWKHGGALSQVTGAPPIVGKPFGYAWEGDGTQHVVYRSTDNQIHELWQRQGKQWEYGNAISQMLNAPPAVGNPVGYAWEHDGTQHIIYRAADNQIHELWQRQGKKWEHGGAISQFTGATLAAGDPVGYAWEEDDTQHLVYRGIDNQIHELWQRRGKKWEHGGALSQITGAPPAAGDPTCYAWGKDGTQHIVYRGAEGHIHEIWFRKGTGWKYGNALSQMAGAPPTAGEPSGYAWEGDGTQHVVYRGQDNHIHELWFRQGKGWQYGQVLTQMTGAALAAGDPFGFAWEEDHTQHVVYRAVDNQIHELWFRK